jgi:hypothetical protein
MTSTFNKEKIRRFAERITPKSWNIILHEKDALKTAGVLNILLSIQGQDSQVYADIYGNKCYEYQGRCGENLRASIIKEQLTMERHHGPRFQKALLSLAKRAIREFGEEIPEDDVFWKTLKFELESFMR